MVPVVNAAISLVLNADTELVLMAAIWLVLKAPMSPVVNAPTSVEVKAATCPLVTEVSAAISPPAAVVKAAISAVDRLCIAVVDILANCAEENEAISAVVNALISLPVNAAIWPLVAVVKAAICPDVPVVKAARAAVLKSVTWVVVRLLISALDNPLTLEDVKFSIAVVDSVAICVEVKNANCAEENAGIAASWAADIALVVSCAVVKLEAAAVFNAAISAVEKFWSWPAVPVVKASA